jgi:outer membrane protein assembly factor BamB
VVPQTRIDARDLGYSPVDLIPDGESAITSLSLAPDGDLFGATSGTRSHLFVINPVHGYVVPIGVIPDAQSVTQALVISATGSVYLGASPSGHLLEYVPQNLENLQIEIGKPLPVTDRGSAVPGESIGALTIDRARGLIYGLTKPNAHLFRFSIAQNKFTDFGVIAKDPPPAEKFEHEKMMSRMLVIDSAGNVFATGENASIYRLLTSTGTLEKLSIRVPAVPGREPYTKVDAFLLDRSGTIYGGTSDGYLFRLDPEKLSIVNLGKPLNQYHIAGLASGPDGKLYGVGGDTSEMARMFSFDPSTGAYEVLGFVDVNRRPYYTWQAYEIGAIASDTRGTVYLGEDERISKLYLYYP